MQVEVKSVRKDFESCNFCDRGKLEAFYQNSLQYPYDQIYSFRRSTRSGIVASICDDCLNELTEKVKTLKDKTNTSIAQYGEGIEDNLK